jgi:hypothetical protein
MAIGAASNPGIDLLPPILARVPIAADLRLGSNPETAARLPAGEGGPGVSGEMGMVVREDSGERILQSTVWGWPLRLKGMKPESKPKPVNNIADV